MDEARLKAIPLFAGLNRKECRALAPRADEVDLEEGRTMVREGEWPYEFFAIEQGTAEVRRGDQLLAELGPGDFFGEAGVLEKDQRSATVVAKTPMRLVTLTGWDLRRMRNRLGPVLEKLEKAIDERRPSRDGS
jgi:cAMP-dependent protein kinase regulator